MGKVAICTKPNSRKGNIGASFAYTPSYALDCRPMNAMAKCNYDDLKNYWWMDVYAYGRYPIAAMTYLKRRTLLL